MRSEQSIAAVSSPSMPTNNNNESNRNNKYHVEEKHAFNINNMMIRIPSFLSIILASIQDESCHTISSPTTAAGTSESLL
jgi:hypothetical protein